MFYHNITHDDMLNGDGLRVVLWVAGCEHHCKGCQNPITWNPNGGISFDENAKKEIFAELNKSYISGFTFSGGDPLHKNNVDEVTALAKEIKEKYPQKTIWLYTGYIWNNIKDLEIIQYLDVLVDGKFEIEKSDINFQWAGSTNQNVIDVKKTAIENRIVLYGKE